MEPTGYGFISRVAAIRFRALGNVDQAERLHDRIDTGGQS